MFEDNQRDGDILRSESVLSSNYTPESLIGRDEEIERIAAAVRPLTRKQEPDHVLLHGPAGVGKTSCARYVLDHLDSQTSVQTVHLNCWKYNTRASLLTELLVNLGYPAPRKGKPVDETLSKLCEWLDKNRSVAITLDEVDQLRDLAEVVYDLHSLNEKAVHNVGLIMISNQDPARLQLDPRSSSRIACQTLEFQSYSEEQLRSILEQRVERAFRPNSVTADAIEQIAHQVGQDDGDCRQALDVLLRAGRRAERRGTQVTKQLIEDILD